MKDAIALRIVTVAEHILNTHDTIRKTAEKYGFSKSTIHNDVSVKLKNIDYALYVKIKEILNANFAEKHIRGGEATRRKYEKKDA